MANRNSYLTYKRDTSRIIYWVVQTSNAIIKSLRAKADADDDVPAEPNLSGGVTVAGLVALAKLISRHIDSTPVCPHEDRRPHRPLLGPLTLLIWADSYSPPQACHPPPFPVCHCRKICNIFYIPAVRCSEPRSGRTKEQCVTQAFHRCPCCGIPSVGRRSCYRLGEQSREPYRRRHWHRHLGYADGEQG